MPTSDYYTRHYLTAMTILWASTFSMSVLFLPKVYKLWVVNEEIDDSRIKSMNHVLASLDDTSSTIYFDQYEGSFLLDIYQVNLLSC